MLCLGCNPDRAQQTRVSTVLTATQLEAVNHKSTWAACRNVINCPLVVVPDPMVEAILAGTEDRIERCIPDASPQFQPIKILARKFSLMYGASPVV